MYIQVCQIFRYSTSEGRVTRLYIQHRCNWVKRADHWSIHWMMVNSAVAWLIPTSCFIGNRRVTVSPALINIFMMYPSHNSQLFSIMLLIKVCGCTFWMCVHVSIHVFYSLMLISRICGFVDDLSIGCLGSCVDVVCVCGCVWVFGMRIRQVSRASLLRCNMAFLQSPVAVEHLWRVELRADLPV